MTTHGFTQFVLNNRVQSPAEAIDEAAVRDVAQLISGSLIYRLYESLIENDYDMDALTEHLEMLFDTENHFGLLYFVFILSDATEESLPEKFEGMTANPSLVPYLSGAIIEDWLDFHGDYGS
jgi:hypothetical protein